MSRFAYHIPILGYHRVGDWRADHVPTVSAAAFKTQLNFLSRHRYRVLSLADVVTFLERGEPIPRHSAVITFDDGYEETYQIAWPMLKAAGFPAAIFVTPTEVGLPGFVKWDQLAEMVKDGMAVGSHTMRHSYLPLVKSDRLDEEVIESKRIIEEHIGYPVQFFSYPVGGFSQEIQSVIKGAGYLAACTTNRAIAQHKMDRYALRRIKVTEHDAFPILFWVKLSGYYDLFRQLETPN